jgi:hypothetical protein
VKLWAVWNCAKDRSHAMRVFMISCFNKHGLRRRTEYGSAPVLKPDSGLRYLGLIVRRLREGIIAALKSAVWKISDGARA